MYTKVQSSRAASGYHWVPGMSKAQLATVLKVLVWQRPES